MQIETATKYTFVGHEIYFRGVQNVLSYLLTFAQPKGT